MFIHNLQNIPYKFFESAFSTHSYMHFLRYDRDYLWFFFFYSKYGTMSQVTTQYNNFKVTRATIQSMTFKTNFRFLEIIYY